MRIVVYWGLGFAEESCVVIVNMTAERYHLSQS